MAHGRICRIPSILSVTLLQIEDVVRIRIETLFVVCTAELYNAHILAEDLREQLGPYSGEAALIAALYRRYGEACLERMEGAFAFALWDGSQKQLLLATDRFAMRPALFCYSRLSDLCFPYRR